MTRRVALLLVLLACACTSKRLGPPPGALTRRGYIKSENDFVRIQLLDGRVEKLINARVIGDSVVGYKAQLKPVRLSYATASIKSVETRRIDPFLTLILVAVVGFTVAGFHFVNPLEGLGQ